MQNVPLGSKKPPKVRRVRFSDGGTFDTNARSATHYLLDTCFIRFLFLGILIYSVLSDRADLLDLSLYEQTLLWMVLFLSTGLCLIVTAAINVKLVDRGYVDVIFTPAIFLPVIAINILVSMEFALLMGAREIAMGDLLKNLVQNVVAIICFDILHGRYVAPTHPTFVRPGHSDPQIEELATKEPLTVGLDGNAQSDLPEQGADPENVDAPLRDATEIKALQIPTEPLAIVKIGQQKYPLDIVKYIKSEDHYLKVQLIDKNIMLRGNLGRTIKQIPPKWGGQVNRSAWVAFHAIKKVEEDPKGFMTVTLDDESSFRVSRSRKLIFLSGLESYKEKDIA